MSKNFLILIIATCVFTTACGAPLFSTANERFAPAPEVIEALEPYLADWATLPPEQTEAQRNEIASQIEGVWWIEVASQPIKSEGETVYIVDIGLDGWGDWTRGYLYVHDGSDLAEYPGLSLRRVSENLYIYNRNW